MSAFRAFGTMLCCALLELPQIGFSGTLEKQRETKISIAESCDNDNNAPPTKKIVPVVQPMVSASGTHLCIVPNTRHDLTALTVRAFVNKFEAGSVEIEFSSEGRAHWLRIEAINVGKRMVLLRGENAVLEFAIMNQGEGGKMLIGAADLPQAETIAKVLLGD